MTTGVVLVGIPFFGAVFNVCGECSIQWEDGAIEGKSFKIKGNKIKLATVTGPVSHLLRGERTALNSMLRCSGVATISNQCIQIAKAQK